MERRDVAVVGGGPAGLAVGAAWRTRYDRLHLHTIRALSGLPGRPLPRAFGRYVARDDLVAYLEDTRPRSTSGSFAAEQVWLAVRTPPNIVRRQRFGVPVIDVGLVDGSRIETDAIVAATDAARPGLWFVGFRPALGGLLRRIGRDAPKVARAAASLSSPA